MPEESKNERRITVDQSTAENVAKVLGIVTEIRGNVDEIKRRVGKLEGDMTEIKEEYIRSITKLEMKVETLEAWKNEHNAYHQSNSNKRSITVTQILMAIGVITSIVLGVLSLTKG